VVERGDTLRGIAQTYCGDPSYDDAIAEYNGIRDPTELSVGSEIVIPPDCGE
jgi:nucleoid-associated protein YgaU